MDGTVYTLTMNPAVDYVINVGDNAATPPNSNVLRAVEPCGYSAAGKGVNVSTALTALDIENTAVCICGNGFIGNELVRLIKDKELESVLIRNFDCDTRLNVKICGNDGITEVNGYFSADKAAVEQVTETLDCMLQKGDILVMCGSLPHNVPVDFYAKTAAKARKKGVLVIVDSSGEPLRQAVSVGRPWLIAPNAFELQELLKEGEFAKVTDIVKSGVNVLATLGEQGAVLTVSETASETASESGNSENIKEYVCQPEKPLKRGGYTVGAGDTLLAGFIAEYIKSGDYQKSLEQGVRLAGETIANSQFTIKN